LILRRPLGPTESEISLRQKLRRYFFFAAGFFLATAFGAGIFDAGDLVVFLAMDRTSTCLRTMARKIFHLGAILSQWSSSTVGKKTRRSSAK